MNSQTLLPVFLSKSQTVAMLIDVGGYQLHANIIMGKGLAILFESGAADGGQYRMIQVKNYLSLSALH